jgi:acyl carrier protein
MSIKQQVKQFVLTNYLFTTDESALDDADSLMQKGVVDSTGIEESYGIKVAEDEMIPANLDSIDAVSAFVERKRSK